MGRAALTAEDHAAFRRGVREVAARRFAATGAAGVTMRGIAQDLGCSPMKPYRYFRDRGEILDEVRAAAAEAFAVAQERAFVTEPDPLARLRALARAYVGYALAQPDHYRVQFERPHGEAPPGGPELELLELRGWLPMRNTIGEAIAAGALAGDRDQLAHLCWAAIHGLVALHLAGKLRLGHDLASLVDPTMTHFLAGAAPARRDRRRPQPRERRR